VHFQHVNIVPCPLPTTDIVPDIYHDYTSDVLYDDHNVHLSHGPHPPSSSPSPPLVSELLPFPTTCKIHDDNAHGPHPSSSSSCPTIATEPLPFSMPTSNGEDILRDMLLSRRLTSIRASVLHCSEGHLRKVSSLHGLDVSCCLKVRDIRIRLLYHIINGDCFPQCCESSQPAPDCSACLCVAANFRSSLEITSFVVNLLKKATPSQITTEELLVVVESTGNQLPYENQKQLRRRVFVSLQAFVLRRCHVTQ